MRWGLGNAAAFGCFGFTGRRARDHRHGQAPWPGRHPGLAGRAV